MAAPSAYSVMTIQLQVKASRMQSSRHQAGSAKNPWCTPIRAGHSLKVNAVNSIMIMMQHLLVRCDDRAQHLGFDYAAHTPCLSMHAIQGDTGPFYIQYFG